MNWLDIKTAPRGNGDHNPIVLVVTEAHHPEWGMIRDVEMAYCYPDGSFGGMIGQTLQNPIFWAPLPNPYTEEEQ